MAVIEINERPGYARIELSPGQFLLDSSGVVAELPTAEAVARAFRGDYTSPAATTETKSEPGQTPAVTESKPAASRTAQPRKGSK